MSAHQPVQIFGSNYGDPAIHNYFPDGAVSSDVLIDLANAFTSDKLWQSNTGTETLTYDEVYHSVDVAFDGAQWEQGVTAGDWSDLFGGGNLPAGRYQIGVSVQASAPITLRFSVSGPAGAYPLLAWQPGIVANLKAQGDTDRIIVPIYTVSAGPLSLSAITLQRDYPSGASKPVATVKFTSMMITEGDASVFRDGDSDGWHWSGAAHASASYGPQP